MSKTRVAGIAGGVGTTVLAEVIGGEDVGRDTASADVIVARNDYRCARALVEAQVRPEQAIVLIVEEHRALRVSDFEAVLGRKVLAIDASPAVARADDAGLLDAHVGAVSRFAARYGAGLFAREA